MPTETIDAKVGALVNGGFVNVRFCDPARGLSALVTSRSDPTREPYRTKVALVRGRVETSCTCRNAEHHEIKPMCAHVRTLLRQAPREIRDAAGYYR